MNEQPFDPWDTAQGNEPYREDRIYTRSVDQRGFGTSVRAKVPPDIAAEMSKIVAKEWVPEYRTTADFVRDAIVHRLHYWSERITDKQLQRVVSSERRAAMLEHATREVQNMQAMVLAFEDSFRVALQAGDNEILEDLMTHITESILVAREPYAGKLRAIQHNYEDAISRVNGK
jgi:hypothetical protein